MLLLDSVVELRMLDERESSEELAVWDGLDLSEELGSADEAGLVDEVGLGELSEITVVLDDVDNNEPTSGRSTVTAAVARAVVLPKASALAVTATTTSASEFVLIISVNAAVPWRLSRRRRSSALRMELLWI